MSKRFNNAQQSGDRKKPRLDISVADHNFPLSQNAVSEMAVPDFDDDDDELLLQASQACEQACNVSMLPAYSQFIPSAGLPVTSTQLPSQGSSSKGTFSFKKPVIGQRSTISTSLKDKCDRISSPLRGIASKVTETISFTDNYFNDKVLDTQDTDYVYRQLLQLQEENAKLKCENGKLLDKCVTKEGEATILRTQLKTCQTAVDNARLEKLKTHEQAQIQWSEKLSLVNKQLSDIKTQLDSKNLEIISMKEKCKMLESNKVKLTQITVSGNDMTRLNNSVMVSNSFLESQSRRVKTTSTTVQTDNNPQFLKLSKPCRLDKSKVTQILPLVMDTTPEQQYSILDYNEKLKKPTDFSPNKSRILSSFYRPSSSTDYVSSKMKDKLNMSSIHEDLMSIAACTNAVGSVRENYIRIFDATQKALEGVQAELEVVSRRLTSAFQKEMDKRYMESTTTYLDVKKRDLIAAKALFKEEQCILARRMSAVLHVVLGEPKAVQLFAGPDAERDRLKEFVDLLCSISTLLDDNCCGVFYSGLLHSLVLVVEALAASRRLADARVLDFVRRAVPCRALLFVPCRLLRLLCDVRDGDVSGLCTGTAGNLKFDYDQGVLLFKKDSCLIQVLLRQVETAVQCMERQGLARRVVRTAQDLLRLHASLGLQLDGERSGRCKCGNLLLQVVVHALKICSTMLEGDDSTQSGALATCRAGLLALHRRQLRDGALGAALGYNEGHLVTFCERLAALPHNEFYGTMLSELTSSLAAAEEPPAALPGPTWLRSFDTFSLAD